MATIIKQAPLYDTLPVGQEIIFVVANNNIVANQAKVKFIAEVHISNTIAPNTGSANDLIGTFKTTPNNVGRGMFDLSSVVESYVKAENSIGRTTGIGIYSKYKLDTITSTSNLQAPLHLVDQFAANLNTMRYLRIQFKTEYLDATTNQIVTVGAVNSELFKIFNGYLKHTDRLRVFSNSNTPFGFGKNMSIFQLSSSFPATNTKRFLTNASVTQYANIEDYGTVAFLDPNNNLEYIKLDYLDSSGSSLATDDVPSYIAITPSGYISYQLMYFGCYPANLRGWSSNFNGNIDDIASYTIQAFDDTDAAVSKQYTININCPTLKGYVPIRLAWLNQWGAWDYYTFTQKSVRSLSTKGSTYTQQSGSWNKSLYRPKGFKGGMKSFRVNATERIKMNTDFVNEAESEWFEELINSPEIYILEGFKEDLTFPLLNTYVTPVRLLTSSYTRKTIANDKLMQYTLEVEKSKTLRTQSV
jgi:hypothetical protein